MRNLALLDEHQGQCVLVKMAQLDQRLPKEPAFGLSLGETFLELRGGDDFFFDQNFAEATAGTLHVDVRARRGRLRCVGSGLGGLRRTHLLRGRRRSLFCTRRGLIAS